jgi:hypothetical protein
MPDICKNLGGRALCKIQRFRASRNPFVFKDRLLGSANFSKFFLGRNQGNQRVASEKIWIRRFLRFRGSRCGYGSIGWRLSKCQHSTIPHFPKQFVAVPSVTHDMTGLGRARSVRQRLALLGGGWMRRTETHQGVRMIKFVSILIAKQTPGHRSFEIAYDLSASRAAGLLDESVAAKAFIQVSSPPRLASLPPRADRRAASCAWTHGSPSAPLSQACRRSSSKR